MPMYERAIYVRMEATDEADYDDKLHQVMASVIQDDLVEFVDFEGDICDVADYSRVVEG